MGLLENDVAVEVAERICNDIKQELLGKPIQRGRVDSVIKSTITNTLHSILKPGFDLVDTIKKSDKPYTIVFVGVNGGGKTTSIAKVANLCLKNNLTPVLAASDTFRAAAVEQLEEHANNLGVKMIKHRYGADPAAVAFDAVEHAKSSGKDVVLIDTAGRLQSNANLMDELKKILKVISPNLVIFVGDAMTGNDAAVQAQKFNDIRIDAIMLTKADTDPKGGSCISISYITEKPILYLGTGQTYDDLTQFTPEWFVSKII